MLLLCCWFDCACLIGIVRRLRLVIRCLSSLLSPKTRNERLPRTIHLCTIAPSRPENRTEAKIWTIDSNVDVIEAARSCQLWEKPENAGRPLYLDASIAEPTPGLLCNGNFTAPPKMTTLPFLNGRRTPPWRVDTPKSRLNVVFRDKSDRGEVSVLRLRVSTDRRGAHHEWSFSSFGRRHHFSLVSYRWPSDCTCALIPHKSLASVLRPRFGLSWQSKKNCSRTTEDMMVVFHSPTESEDALIWKQWEHPHCSEKQDGSAGRSCRSQLPQRQRRRVAFKPMPATVIDDKPCLFTREEKSLCFFNVSRPWFYR